MAPDFSKAISLIDAAHAEDPNTITPADQSSSSSSSNPIPYELHYANKMTHYLHLHTPNASPLLRLAVRAQHLRRWEIPRSSRPEGKAGYLAWRTFLKNRQAELARDICLRCGYSVEEAEGVARLVRKEGLGRNGEGEGDAEVQVLEDVACLVFLDDQLEGFERGLGDPGKMVGILRKTWGKMGGRGRELAGRIEMSARARGLVELALEG